MPWALWIEKRTSYLFSTIAQDRHSLSLATPPLAWLRLVTTLWPVAARRHHVALAPGISLFFCALSKVSEKFCSNGDELIFLQSQQELVNSCALGKLYNKDDYLLDKATYGDGGRFVVISGR